VIRRRYQAVLQVVSLQPNRYIEHMNREFEAGRLKPVIDRVYPLEKIAEAMHRFSRSEHIGKIIIRPA